MIRFVAAVAFVMTCGSSWSANAQGLIWNLPEDKTWVRYEGTFTQVDRAPTGDIKLEWLRQLTIRSVGQEDGEFDGETIPCRWLEFVVKTGTQSEAGIDTGAVGYRIYKVLVPERVIVTNDTEGKVIDGDTIPVSLLPIVRGYRKFGESEPKEITSGVLQVNPLLSLLMHYPEIKPDDTNTEEPDTPVNPTVTTPFFGSITTEGPTERTVNTGVFWRSEDVPFGLASWHVTVTRETKGLGDPRETFQEVSTMTVVMSAHETGTDALSELQTPAAGAP